MSRNNRILRRILQKASSPFELFKIKPEPSGLMKLLEQLKASRETEFQKRSDSFRDKQYALAWNQANFKLMKKVASVGKKACQRTTPQEYFEKICYLCMSLRKNFSMKQFKEVQQLISEFNTQESFSINFMRKFEEILKEKLKISSQNSPQVNSAAHKLLIRLWEIQYEVCFRTCNIQGILSVTLKILEELNTKGNFDQIDIQNYFIWSHEHAQYLEKVKSDKTTAAGIFRELIYKPFFKDYPQDVQQYIVISYIRLECESNSFREYPQEIIST